MRLDVEEGIHCNKGWCQLHLLTYLDIRSKKSTVIFANRVFSTKPNMVGHKYLGSLDRSMSSCLILDRNFQFRFFPTGAPVVELCRQCCYDLDVIQAALSTKLFASLCKLAARTREQARATLHLDAADAAEALLTLVAPANESSADDARALKVRGAVQLLLFPVLLQRQFDFLSLQIALPSLKHLCRAHSDLTPRLVASLLSFLFEELVAIKTITAKLLLEAVADIALTRSGIVVFVSSFAKSTTSCRFSRCCVCYVIPRSPSIAVLCDSHKQLFELLRSATAADSGDDPALVQKIAVSEPRILLSQQARVWFFLHSCNFAVRFLIQRVLGFCLKLLLCVVLFIGNRERRGSTSNKMVQDVLLSSSLNHWTLYKIARQASRLVNKFIIFTGRWWLGTAKQRTASST